MRKQTSDLHDTNTQGSEERAQGKQQEKQPQMDKENGKDIGTSQAFPLLPISVEQLERLLALMLVYYQSCTQQPGMNRRRTTEAVLTWLIPRLSQGIATVNTETPLLLLVDEVQVIKMGIATILMRLKKRASTPEIQQEIQQAEALQKMFEQTFRTTQD